MIDKTEFAFNVTVIGERISEQRSLNNLTQLQLSEAIGMGITAINNYENGHRIPDALFILKLAHFFRVTADYLLGLDDVNKPPKYDMSTLGGRIAFLRTDKGLTQKQLADVVKMNRDTVTKWESGERGINNKFLVLLADYFNVSTDWLLCRTDIRQGKEESDT